MKTNRILQRFMPLLFVSAGLALIVLPFGIVFLSAFRVDNQGLQPTQNVMWGQITSVCVIWALLVMFILGLLYKAVTRQLARSLHSRNHFAQIVEEAANEIYMTDASTLQILYMNRAARENLGYSMEECSGLHPWDVIECMTPEHIGELTESLHENRARFREFESEHIRKDGSRYPIFSSLQYIGSQDPPVYAAIVQDVTEQRRQEHDLCLRDRAIEALDVGVCITDASKPDYPLVYVNSELCDMTGYSREELIGQGVRILQKDNRYQPGHRQIQAAQTAGQHIQVIVQSTRKDGSHYMDEVTLSPIHDSKGQLAHFIGIHRDVTQPMQTQAQLHRAQKIEAVGQLAGGMSHDFNNILNVITGNLEFLNRNITDREMRRFINQADTAAQMGTRLTHRLLNFARRRQLEHTVLNVNEQVLDALELLRSTIGDNISLSVTLPPDLWSICVDPSEIENTVVNLVLNSRDAMPDGGAIRIVTENLSVTGDAVEALGVVPGDYVQLTVSDTGKGMPEEIRKHIFEPFFSTKDKARSTGLGLASIHGFARQSGGNVLVCSDVKVGTEMRVLLPRHTAQVVQTPYLPAPLVESANLNGCILVVEDNDMVLDVTVERLRNLGYHTREARNGPEALQVMRSESDIGLILTDIMMGGGMSGYDVAQWVQTHRPECKILLTTGFSKDTAIQGSADIENLRILHKPYKMDDLQKSLSGILVQKSHA